MTDDRDRHRLHPAQPRPTSRRGAVQLWAFNRGAHRWCAALQPKGSWGIEVHILRNRTFRLSRRFAKRSQAVAWATEERTALEQAVP